MKAMVEKWRQDKGNKYFVKKYTEDEIKECQENADFHDCTDCQCTTEECLKCLEAVRYQKHE